MTVWNNWRCTSVGYIAPWCPLNVADVSKEHVSMFMVEGFAEQEISLNADVKLNVLGP
jgi:hypothetical protein